MKDLIKNEIDGAVFYTSSDICTAHGFSTRSGGVSRPVHLATMNLGRNLGDDPASVDENYRRFCRCIGVDPESVVYTDQVHSADVVTVGAEDAGKSFTCDGFVTAERGITLSVRTADCVPILFWHPRGVIGACHAGWRGTVAHIQRETVRKMCELGADVDGIRCAVGAAIRLCCYEVGEDFVDAVRQTAGDELCDRFIARGKWEKPHADIVGMNVALLLEAGLKADNISVCGECTCCRPDVFFSHRASGGKRGVMAAMISL